MIIAIIGEAGSGKDYFVEHLTKKYKKLFHKITSYTTRPKRDNEEEGKDYYFTTKEHFLDMIENKSIVEYTEFNGWYYGTHECELDNNKMINIGVFDPQGVRNLIQLGYSVIIFKLHVPDKERLIRQLNREEDPDIEEIIRRYQTDKEDFANLDFPFISLFNLTKQDLRRNIKRVYQTILDKIQ